MRKISSRSSATSPQILVPTSTIDWCSSRLICSPSVGAPEASSSETCERSSQVFGIDDLELFLHADGEPVGHGGDHYMSGFRVQGSAVQGSVQGSFWVPVRDQP